VSLMYSIDPKKQLKDFAAALAVPVGLTDGAKWPVRAGTVIFPVRNILVREYIEQVETSGIIGRPEEWRKAFDGPTQIWRTSHHLINGLEDDNEDKRYIAKQILLLLEGIAALNNGHYFHRMGEHIILNSDDVKKAVNIQMITDKKSAKKALLLAGLLWSYSEANYFVAHELTCEYHGAYPLHDGTFAVIREFKNLRPSDLWPERNYEDIPNYIRIITIHDSTLDIAFDAYNNLYDEKGTLGVSLLKAVAVVDGSIISLSDIECLLDVLGNKTRVFTDEVDAMSKVEIGHRYTDVFWYRKKSLAKYIGVSWESSKDIHRILEEGLAIGPKRKIGSNPSGRTLVDELAKIYDYSDYLEVK